jgi:hypothetical protein
MHNSFQDSSSLITVRSSAVLTNSYVAGTVLETFLQNQLVLMVNFTKGSLTTAEVKLEFSYDGTNYVQETFRLITGGSSAETLGEHVYSASGAYTIDLPIMYRYVRVSAKGTGTVTDSLMGITAVIGTV